MARPHRVIFFAAVLLLVGSRDVCHALVVHSCSSFETIDGRTWCTIRNMTIQSETDASSASFPSDPIIILTTPKVKNLSSTLMNQMPAVEELTITGGEVSVVYVKPTLSRLWAERNEVQEVLIDGAEKYNLKHFVVVYNKLRSVPKNIEKLTQLVNLLLYHNQIEAVDMNVLKDLSHLESVSFKNNRIIQLDTTIPLKLPNLLALSLEENQLQELSIGKWDFPILRSFDLHTNKLRSMEGFPERFSKLRLTAIYGNRWSCGWLERAVRVLQSNDLYLGRDTQCLSKNVSGICCDERL